MRFVFCPFACRLLIASDSVMQLVCDAAPHGRDTQSAAGGHERRSAVEQLGTFQEFCRDLTKRIVDIRPIFPRCQVTQGQMNGAWLDWEYSHNVTCSAQYPTFKVHLVQSWLIS